jgi:glycosyltransferase involved in cell wall biosynthesis
MENKPLISVLIISYNHERYIQQTLESVLAQETNFPYEIVIGDDASTDKTVDLCRAYMRQYPEIIRVLGTPQNLGVVPNFLRTLQACRGKYIAHLDGDDYWIDTEKLQKQVNKLEIDPNLTICYTSRKIYDEDIDRFYTPAEGEKDKRYYAKDFAHSTFFHLSTIAFRKPDNVKVIQNLATFKRIVDRPLSIILLEESGGYAIKIPDICAVFRMNNQSTYTPADEIKRGLMANDMYHQLGVIYPHLSKYFNHHLNVTDYFMLRSAFVKKDYQTVQSLANQIIRRPTFAQNWRLKFKTALHIPLSILIRRLKMYESIKNENPIY